MSVPATRSLHLANELADETSREVVRVAERAFGHVLTSILTSLRPWPVDGGPDPGRSVEFVSRLVFGDPRLSLVAVAHDGGSLYVSGASGSVWIPRLSPVGRSAGNSVDLPRALTPHADGTAANDVVEELTRRVYALPLEVLDGVHPDRSVKPFAWLPVLSSDPGLGLLARTHRAPAYLATLRDVEAGAPVEWARRHHLGGEP